MVQRFTSAVLVVATVLAFAMPALAQKAAQDTCDWYWDYNYVS